MRLRISYQVFLHCITVLFVPSEEFGAESKDADDEFVDAEGDGWGGDDDLDLEVCLLALLPLMA